MNTVSASDVYKRQGSYFSPTDNPYAPYCDYNLNLQIVEDAARKIIERISDPLPPFRFQTDEASKNIIDRHLKDYTGMDWYLEQKIKN